MTNDLAQRVILIVTFVVLVLRWFNGMRQAEVPRHKVWTFGLSLAGWIALYLRLTITRNFELIAPFDPLATLSWAFVLVTQSAGFAYEWMPAALRRRIAERRHRWTFRSRTRST